MKLRHTIAGTLALPLALAVASANAATVFDDERGKLQVGGYISGIASWNKTDRLDHKAFGEKNDSGVDTSVGLGLSRLNFTYTNDAGVKLFYENDWAGTGKIQGSNDGGTGYRLRHAAVSYNGLVAGQTWSGFANLTGLGETIDAAGTSGTSSWANRTAVVGYNAPVADGMTVGIYLEDQSVGSDRNIASLKTAATAIPDITANFKGDFGMAQAFVGLRYVQVEEDVTGPKETEGKFDFALGVSADVTEQLNLKFAATMYDEGVILSPEDRDIAISVAAGFKVNEQLRFNAVVEQFIAGVDSDASYTGLWLNGFYTLDSGLELGAELQYTNGGDFRDADLIGKLAAADQTFDANDYADEIGKLDGDLVFRLQAKYAF